MHVQHWTKFGIHLQFAESAYICGFHLRFRESKQLAIFACCGSRDTTNVPTNFTLHSYVRGIHRSFVSGIHLLFGTCLKINFWNPGTYRHKVVRLTVWPRSGNGKRLYSSIQGLLILFPWIDYIVKLLINLYLFSTKFYSRSLNWFK